MTTGKTLPPVAGIYSFPKSGNTWIRQIIAARISRGEDAGTALRAIPDLHQSAMETARDIDGFRFYKHHSGRVLEKWRGQILGTTHVIHIRRNPLDVFLSTLNFISDNVEGSAPLAFGSVDEICGTALFDMYFHAFVVTGRVLAMPVSKDYFAHNRYWLEQQARRAGPKTVCIRYEDLMDDTLGTLDFLNTWLGLGPGDLQTMIDVADRRTDSNGKFFWKRRQKNFLSYLSRQQIELFWTYRGAQTQALGYDRSYFLTDPGLTGNQ